jgi:hypothetical protein
MNDRMLLSGAAAWTNASVVVAVSNSWPRAPDLDGHDHAYCGRDGTKNGDELSAAGPAQQSAEHEGDVAQIAQGQGIALHFAAPDEAESTVPGREGRVGED